MRVEEVIAVLQQIAPLAHAEPWDNVGLLAGDPEGDGSRMLLAIDYTPEVARETIDGGYGLVIAYHPPLFGPIKRFTAEHPLFETVLRGIAIYSPHTALDAAPGGTNDVLADTIELRDRSPLRRAAPADRPPAPTFGMGRIGSVGPIDRRDLIGHAGRALELEHLLVSGPADGEISRAAVCAGSAGDLLEAAIAGGAELVLAGEVKHHDALAAARCGVTVVATLHSNSERKALARLRSEILRRAPGASVALSKADRDPFTVVSIS